MNSGCKHQYALGLSLRVPLSEGDSFKANAVSLWLHPTLLQVHSSSVPNGPGQDALQRKVLLGNGDEVLAGPKTPDLRGGAEDRGGNPEAHRGRRRQQGASGCSHGAPVTTPTSGSSTGSPNSSTFFILSGPTSKGREEKLPTTHGYLCR